MELDTCSDQPYPSENIVGIMHTLADAVTVRDKHVKRTKSAGISAGTFQIREVVVNATGDVVSTNY